jgi:hypothetical protein
MDATAGQKTPVAPIYTHGKFWGGTVLPFWVYLTVAAFPLTGFFGLDHLLFRSPSTAILKGFTNVFTLGLWYVYDILQAFSDRSFIHEYGFSQPITGPAGLALDYFRGVTGGAQAEPESKSGFFGVALFIIYCLTLFIPFGVSNFVAGDTNGGIAKFLLSFGPWGLIWIPFLFVVAFYEAFLVAFKSQEVFEHGLKRVPPISWFIAKDGYAPNIMSPEAMDKMASEANNQALAGIYPFFIKPVLKFFGIKDPMEVLDTTKCTVVPPVKDTIEAAQVAGKGVMKIAAKVPEIAQEATEKLTAFTDPAALKAAAAASAISAIQQKGGSLESSPLDMILIGGLAILIAGGIGASILRRMEHRKTDTIDDTPPNPRAV